MTRLEIFNHLLKEEKFPYIQSETKPNITENEYLKENPDGDYFCDILVPLYREEFTITIKSFDELLNKFNIDHKSLTDEFVGRLSDEFYEELIQDFEEIKNSDFNDELLLKVYNKMFKIWTTKIK